MNVEFKGKKLSGTRDSGENKVWASAIGSHFLWARAQVQPQGYVNILSVDNFDPLRVIDMQFKIHDHEGQGTNLTMRQSTSSWCRLPTSLPPVRSLPQAWASNAYVRCCGTNQTTKFYHVIEQKYYYTYQAQQKRRSAEVNPQLRRYDTQTKTRPSSFDRCSDSMRQARSLMYEPWTFSMSEKAAGG